MTVVLRGLHDFTLDTAHEVAWGKSSVRLSDAAIAGMQTARDRFDALIENPDLVIYGVTSGYGQQAKDQQSDIRTERPGKHCEKITDFGER